MRMLEVLLLLGVTVILIVPSLRALSVHSPEFGELPIDTIGFFPATLVDVHVNDTESRVL
jgi:hypothetical protein